MSNVDSQRAESRRDLLKTAAVAAGAALAPSAVMAQAEAEPFWKKHFGPGFRNERIKTSGAEINAVIGGSGPPMLMYHGAPQSLATWHLIAADLAKDYTLVMCDLRGYGDSSRPADGENHAGHSKSAMALDGVEVMKHLGYNQFRMVGHDRGGRAGRRMALNHPEAVSKLLVIDIVPAHYLYSHVTIDFVRAYFHWFNYLRAAPGPENELKLQNDAQLARGGNMSDLQREYLRHTTDITMLHAMCEDYRASASLDLDRDHADIKAGKKIQCPLHVLWAATGAMGKLYDVLGIWQSEGVKVTGKGLPGGHSLQETTPKETLAEIQTFMKG
jgi:haloacetate dehalogenase